MAVLRIKVIQSRAGDSGLRRILVSDSYSGLTGVDRAVVCPSAGDEASVGPWFRGARRIRPDRKKLSKERKLA